MLMLSPNLNACMGQLVHRTIMAQNIWVEHQLPKIGRLSMQKNVCISKMASTQLLCTQTTWLGLSM